MRRILQPRWQVFVSGSLVLLLALLVTVGGGGKALAASFAAFLSGRSAGGTQLEAIEVLSWSHEIKSPRDAASGQATGRRQHQPLLIRKRIDKASPLLMKALAESDTFPTLTLTVQLGGKGDGLTITLTDAQVTQINVGDVDADGFPDESVTFVYKTISWSGNGASYQDEWADDSPPIYGMAINEKGLPGSYTKDKKKVTAYQTRIVSPRDAASGLPTGKRQHHPLLLVTPGSDNTHDLTQAYLTGAHLERVSVITYGSGGEPTGAVSLVGVQVVSMTETRVWGDPHVDEGRKALQSAGSNPLYEASVGEAGMDCVYELVYQKIQWLDAAGEVLHEDTWDDQR